ncbi:MAG: aminoacyl-tRNA hydrolase [Parvularculaceae bacterium]|nr:MAG: aminoacyl-tRNA hydrolase [Parvularculaceae bacterium]
MTHAEQFLRAEAIEESFIRASGPGGQNVNKVASAVQLRFFPERAGLPPRARRRLLALAGSRATQTGAIVIEASNSRSQERNRAAARQRLIDLITKSLIEPKRRLKTKPTLASRKRRMDQKKQRGELKKSRGRIRSDP